MAETSTPATTTPATSAPAAPSPAPSSTPSTPSQSPSTSSSPVPSTPAAKPSGGWFKQELSKAFQPPATTPPTTPQIDPAIRDQWMKEARTKFESDFAPYIQMAASVTPEDFRVAAPYLQALARDPHQFFLALAQHYGYQVSRPGQPQQPQTIAAPQDDEPPPDLRTADGQLLYSNTQLAKREAWREARLMQKIRADWNKEIQPFRQVQQEAASAQFMKQIESKAFALIKEAETWEGFTDLRGHIAQLMKQDKRVTLHSAYQRAYRDHYAPGRDEALKKQWTEEQATRSRAASTGGSPGTTVQGRTTGPINGSTRDAFRRELADRLGIH